MSENLFFFVVSRFCVSSDCKPWLTRNIFHWTVCDNIKTYLLAWKWPQLSEALSLDRGIIYSNFFFNLLIMHNLLWIILHPASTLISPTLYVFLTTKRSYSRVSFTAKSSWTTNSVLFRLQKHCMSMSSVRQLQWNLQKTPPHIDQRRMETEPQTFEGRRTQVSNCSNTDIMKWIQIQ